MLRGPGDWAVYAVLGVSGEGPAQHACWREQQPSRLNVLPLCLQQLDVFSPAGSVAD